MAFDLLNNKSQRVSHLRNLVLIALADGVLGEAEETLLLERAKSLNISSEELDRIKSSQHNFEFVVPKNQEEKALQLFDLVKMTMADDSIHPQEHMICRTVAARFDLLPRIVDDLIKYVVKETILGKREEEIVESMIERLNNNQPLI
ncbi:MAG: TerB family tellurite resistance protein [Bacteroidota bacterium]